MRPVSHIAPDQVGGSIVSGLLTDFEPLCRCRLAELTAEWVRPLSKANATLGDRPVYQRSIAYRLQEASIVAALQPLRAATD